MKVLASLAIAGAVLAMLTAMLVSGIVMELLVLALAIATAVFLFLQRDTASIVAGAVLVLVALLLALPVMGGISNEDGTIGAYLDATQTHAFVVILALMVAAVPLLAWNECGPMWARVVGAAGLLISAVLVLVIMANTDPLDQTTALGGPGGMAIAAGLLALAGIVPAVFLLRDAGDAGSAGHPSSG